MKINKIVVSLFAAGLMASPFANATNGDHMMAAGSQNSALGGTGVAHFVGAESTFANPAMLGKSKGAEVTGGFVLFKPAITNTGMPGGTAQTSTADTNYIPDVSYSNRTSDSLTYGVAMGGIAGMGVDFTGASPAHVKAKSALSILRVIPTVAYNESGYGLGFSPVFQYGSLMLSYNNGAAYNGAEDADTDTGFGYSIGGYVNVNPELTLAAAYQSAIKMQYGTQISGAGTGFGLCSPAGGPCTGLPTFGDDLTQPAEMRAGVSYAMNSNLTVTADYKLIKWSSAGGYKDFNWEDQTVIAVGAKYSADGYWLGLGYNNANDPIGGLASSGTVPSDYRKSAINAFNNMFFPAVVESSFTFGGGYSISKELDIEASVVISPEVTKTVEIPHFDQFSTGIITNTTTHSQKAYSVSLRYKF
ncbi:MAG: outer membrane protein transport protein [Gallionella sp.]|nr:outer membrane protein transport protein [Gallionella sp.]